MCLQQTDLSIQGEQEEGQKSFVVSLFGVRDDIKAHHTAERARVCGATWKAFLEYAGATVEDVWGGVEESSRTLWSVRRAGRRLTRRYVIGRWNYNFFFFSVRASSLVVCETCTRRWFCVGYYCKDALFLVFLTW